MFSSMSALALVMLADSISDVDCLRAARQPPVNCCCVINYDLSFAKQRLPTAFHVETNADGLICYIDIYVSICVCMYIWTTAVNYRKIVSELSF